MAEKVILDEGGSVSVHTRIKDMCKAARNRLGYTNQDICNQISERFGIEDFSINTVNNFFQNGQRPPRSIPPAISAPCLVSPLMRYLA